MMTSMCCEYTNTSDRVLALEPMVEASNRAIRVEQVDNWHPRWEQVLEAVEQLGHFDSLCLDDDGWLSARRIVLVAFSDDGVAGYLSFRVQPTVTHKDRPVLSDRGRPAVEGQLESYSVHWEFSEEEVGRALRFAARRRSRSIGCIRLVGLEQLI